MKKIMLLVTCLLAVFGAVLAKTKPVETPKSPLESSTHGREVSASRNVPTFTFSKLPTSLMDSYYDYMIGSYDCLPLQVIPDTAGGGYFLTYHAKRTPTGTRRVFYAHLDSNGNVLNNNEITATTMVEGYPSVAVDYVSGKPIYAWHTNADADTQYETVISSDAFLSGISGLFNDVQVVIDNPITVSPEVGTPTNDNEFLWPKAVIGPSPVAGMRRIYVSATNYVSHSYGPCGNPRIMYADFDEYMIENAIPLVWSSTSIPLMDQWNHNAQWRRPYMDIAVDDMGNLYYLGYHFATEADGSTNIDEADFVVFVCPNYGQGTWTHNDFYTHIPSWNPAGTPNGTGYFVDSNQVAYPDSELVWAVVNSGPKNAIVDDYGQILMPLLWSQSTREGGYWDSFHTLKLMKWDLGFYSHSVTEIYPKKDWNDTHNQCYTPWDVTAPFGVPEYFPDENNELYLNPEVIFPFPHWDDTLHNEAMYLHYSHVKISKVNEHGMMVAVWQDSQRARWANKYNDPDYAAFSNTPEIYISVSSHSGHYWSEPIVLNNVETPEFAGIKPMWVYPADKVVFVGTANGDLVGKIGLFFYDDNTWGANAISPAAHPVNDGGRIMFMELQINFPFLANDDSTTPVVTKMLNPNYPNPFNPETTISFDMPKTGKARLDIYNVKGQIVNTLFDGIAEYGKTNLIWNGTDNSGATVTSGVYIYRLSTDKHSETRKMMLMK